MTNYRFLVEALYEYEDAIEYYERAQVGLGETFVQDVERALALTLEFRRLAPLSAMKLACVLVLLVGCSKQEDDCQRFITKIQAMANTFKYEKGKAIAEVFRTNGQEMLEGCRAKRAVNPNAPVDPVVQCVLDADGTEAVKDCMLDGMQRRDVRPE